MDTVEELNGTYFYNGIINLLPSELYFWILIDTIKDQMGDIEDLYTLVLILLGQPILNTRWKFRNTTKGTSIASVYARRYLDIELGFRLPTFTNASIRYLKPMMVNNLGKFVGRTIPVLGWVLLASDVTTLFFKATTRYNTVARGDDKIW